jgi:hypothetical protein
MKKISLLLGVITLAFSDGWACTVCKKQQPKILQGITHGAGPESNWDYFLVAAAVAVVFGTFILSMRYLFKPGETNVDHVKNTILSASNYE